MKAIVVDQFGGPEALDFRDVEVGEPGSGEIRVRHHAIGVNFIDTYHRTGLYPNPLPLIPGSEGAGEVISIGAGVTGFKPGDRIAYQGTIGAYTEERIMPAAKAVLLPESIDYETAAAIMLKGLTAYYLLFLTWPVRSGEPSCFRPRPVAWASLPANGPNRSVPASSAPLVIPIRSRWPRPMAATR